MTKDIFKILTARYIGTHNCSVYTLKKKYFKKTFDQSKKWEIKFHELIIGKTIFEIFFDYKAVQHIKN